MSFQILYNGVNVFHESDIVLARVNPTVVLQKDNGYISHVDRYGISIFLKRVECNETFLERHERVKAIIDRFLHNFSPVKIKEDGRTLLDHPCGIVNSVTVSENDYRGGYIPISIEIDCHRTFENTGVVEPVDEVTVSQSGSRMATVTRRISAQGVGPNALQNAKNFVNSRKGINYYMDYFNSSHPLVQRVQMEAPNHLTGSYSLSQTFTYDPEDTLNPAYISTLTYEVETTQENSQLTITINGEITGEISQNSARSSLDQLRNRFNAFDFEAIAQAEYEANGGDSGAAGLRNKTVTEDPEGRTASFTLVYTSLTESGPYIVDETVISQSADSVCIEYGGTVRTDVGCIGDRWSAVKAYFSSLDFKQIIAAKWNRFIKYSTGNFRANIKESVFVIDEDGDASIFFPSTGLRLSVSRITQMKSPDPFTATIGFSFRYCLDGTENTKCLKKLDYALEFNPSIQIYSPFAGLEGRGCYVIQDLGYKRRRTFGISGRANISRCCTVEEAIFDLNTRVNLLSFQYFNVPDKILLRSDTGQSTGENQLNFSFLWSGKEL